jgi:DNA-binding SARP family transcriptional activator
LYEEWVLPQQLRLEDEYAQAVMELLALLQQSDQWQQALRIGGQAVMVDPLREDLHLALMRLLVAAGQPIVALQQYARLEKLYQERLGESPSPMACALADQLRSQAQGA